MVYNERVRVMTQTPRQRLLAGAIELMCERGVHATGLTDLLARSDTARRSIYQNFPGGKSDLMERATRVAGRQIADQLAKFLETGSAAAGVEAMIDDWTTSLQATDYTRGCPVLAAAQSGPDEPAIQSAAAEVFEGWGAQIVDALVASGVPEATAIALGSVVVSTIEGAIVQSRASRSTKPLDDAREILVPMCRGIVTTADESPRDR